MTQLHHVEQDRLQFVTDDAGNKTAVILSISLFESMMDTIDELEIHYFSHHPEELEEEDEDYIDDEDDDEDDEDFDDEDEDEDEDDEDLEDEEEEEEDAKKKKTKK